MSRVDNSYLAESVGYNNGHARGLEAGIDMGLENGYTRGWNEATVLGNQAVAERDATIDKLYSANERLAAENAQLRQHIQLHRSRRMRCALTTKACEWPSSGPFPSPSPP